MSLFVVTELYHVIILIMYLFEQIYQNVQSHRVIDSEISSLIAYEPKLLNVNIFGRFVMISNVV